MAASSEPDRQTGRFSLDEALAVLLRLGELMLRGGSTAIRTREWLGVAARKMGIDDISVSLSLDSISISMRHAGECAMGMREVGPPVIDAARIGELERLAKTIGEGTSPDAIAAALTKIEAAHHRFPQALIVVAIGAASGGFAFLNNGDAVDVIAAGIGGGVGQLARWGLSRLRVNQFGVAALCAAIASGAYVLSIALASHIGAAAAPRAVGFMASVLFLVPGFPLIGALFDTMLLQTAAAVGRFAYGVMVLLAVAFGLSIVIEAAAVDLSRPPPPDLQYALTLLLRAIASFVAGGAFAMLFNNPWRTVVTVGVLALVANSLRLALLDFGMMPAPAAFAGALAVGLGALLLSRETPRIALIVPAIVIMVPGLYAFEMIVEFNRGQIIEALRAFALCGFIVGALAMGLATTRFLAGDR